MCHCQLCLARHVRPLHTVGLELRECYGPPLWSLCVAAVLSFLCGGVLLFIQNARLSAPCVFPCDTTLCVHTHTLVQGARCILRGGCQTIAQKPTRQAHFDWSFTSCCKVAPILFVPSFSLPHPCAPLPPSSTTRARRRLYGGTQCLYCKGTIAHPALVDRPRPTTTLLLNAAAHVPWKNI